jgi:hypothetical protein
MKIASDIAAVLFVLTGLVCICAILVPAYFFIKLRNDYEKFLKTSNSRRF